MAENIDVSFFVPVYKPHFPWLQETVASMVRLAQKSRVSMEILLGDDGSPAESAPDLTVFSKAFPQWIRTFRFTQNRGIGTTSCELARLARGRYIASFDQDDILLPFDLDNAIALLDAHPEYSASYARKFLFNEHGLTGDVHGDIYSPFLAFFNPKININAMLIRREALMAHGSFKPVPFCSINQDTWLMLRLSEDTLLHYDAEEPRALYRVHGGQSSQVPNDDSNWRWMNQEVLSRHSDLYREILQDAPLPIGKSPQENQLISALAGSAFYLNQQHIPFTEAILQKMQQAHPEDPGVWEITLKWAVARQPEKLLQIYDGAMQQFSQMPLAQLLLTSTILPFLKDPQVLFPAVFRRFQELAPLHFAPPRLVLENLPHFQPRSSPNALDFHITVG